jgi:two-component system response regulator HydG
MFHGMVGRSGAMQAFFDRIRRVAAAGTPVLVVGETGTGKELVARAVHACQPQRGPFIAVDCAALPRELTASELLGYVRGAFSGAGAARRGVSRAQSAGTLLLDEITAMSAALQAVLLGALEKRDELPFDARIIASTRSDPATAVASGALRGDLYERLAAGAIAIPALREHRDDIVPLVEHRLVLLNEQYTRVTPGVRGITADAMGELQLRPWPGNVRELFEAVAHGFAAARELHIRLCDLPSPARDVSSAPDDQPEPIRRPPHDQTNQAKRYAFSAESSRPTSSLRTRLPRP